MVRRATRALRGGRRRVAGRGDTRGSGAGAGDRRTEERDAAGVAAEPLVRTPAPPERPSDIGQMLRAGGAALAAIVVAAAALRFATLGVQSFSDDELFTTWLTRMPFGRMVSTVPESEATPHFFYLLEWLATRVTGTGEVGMRALPAVTGTLVVPAVYVAGAIAAGRRVALAAAAFAAVNPFLVWYSQ